MYVYLMTDLPSVRLVHLIVFRLISLVKREAGVPSVTL
jgi:hypothetical protein